MKEGESGCRGKEEGGSELLRSEQQHFMNSHVSYRSSLQSLNHHTSLVRHGQLIPEQAKVLPLTWCQFDFPGPSPEGKRRDTLRTRLLLHTPNMKSSLQTSGLSPSVESGGDMNTRHQMCYCTSYMLGKCKKSNFKVNMHDWLSWNHLN